MTTRKICLDCRVVFDGRGSRCKQCGLGPAARYTGGWQKLRRQVLTDWRTKHGNLCPGWQRDAHPATGTNRLSVDHVDVDGSRIQVLCLSCNSRRANRRRAGPAGTTRR